MRITESQLRRIIRQEVRALRENTERMSSSEGAPPRTSAAVEQIFLEFSKLNPAMLSNPRVQEAIEDYDFFYHYNDMTLSNQLVLHDPLYRELEEMGLIQVLRDRLETELARRVPVKKARTVEVIPRSEYQYAEDDWVS